MAFDELDDNEEAARIRMQEEATDHIFPVSYTHLTLPTKA